jgi:hypothetical protein
LLLFADDKKPPLLLDGKRLSVYSLEPLPRGGLVFGYARIDEEAIPGEVKNLAAALEQI